MTLYDPMHFERQADNYARARPPYPAALWDRLGELGLLTPGSRALDLGPVRDRPPARSARQGSRWWPSSPDPNWHSDCAISTPVSR